MIVFVVEKLTCEKEYNGLTNVNYWSWIMEQGEKHLSKDAAYFEKAIHIWILAMSNLHILLDLLPLNLLEYQKNCVTNL